MIHRQKHAYCMKCFASLPDSSCIKRACPHGQLQAARNFRTAMLKLIVTQDPFSTLPTTCLSWVSSTPSNLKQ